MKKNNKGFTLMEMLIVVAIIGVLVAIAIPAVTQNLQKSKQAADAANVRAAYAEASAGYLLGGNASATTGVMQADCAGNIDIGGYNFLAPGSTTSGAKDVAGWSQGQTVTVTVGGTGASFSYAAAGSGSGS